MASSFPASDYVEILQRRRKDFIATLKQTDLVEFSTELRKSLVISQRVKNQFDSLDFDHLDVSLQIRYLLQQVGEQVKNNPSVFENFLEVVTKLDIYKNQVIEQLKKDCKHAKLRGETDEAIDKGMGIYFAQKDVQYLTEILAEVSFKWQEIGLMLGLPPNVLEDCSCGSSTICLSKVLINWILSNQASLEKLKTALCSKVVGLSRIAEDLEKKYGVATAPKYSCEQEMSHSSSLFYITYQSCNTEVADGKSTLLEVQVNSSEPVSYQWTKDGEPLRASPTHSGIQSDILFINNASQGTQGGYVCYINHASKEVFSDTITLSVKFSPMKEHLLNLYSKYREVPADSWPTFINPSICIYTIETDTQPQFKEATEVFQTYKSGTLVLVEGHPGSGKSTFTRKLVIDWAKGDVLAGVKFVFLIPLRLCNLPGTDDSLTSLLSHLYHSEKQDLPFEVMESIEKSDGEGVCFILDGSDEYDPQCRWKSVIYKLLNKVYLPQSMIIVSSRPEVNSSELKKKANVVLELTGFSREKVLNYIDSFLFSSGVGAAKSCAQASTLKEYLKSHSNTFDMCRLPMCTAMICLLYQHKKEIVFSTETKIYEELVKFMILRHYKRTENTPPSISHSGLLDPEKKYLETLCKLAIDMTANSRHTVSVGESPDDPANASFFGLVSVDRAAELIGFEVVHMRSFLHTTLQEFLAAYYITQFHDQDKQLGIISNLPFSNNV